MYHLELLTINLRQISLSFIFLLMSLCFCAAQNITFNTQADVSLTIDDTGTDPIVNLNTLSNVMTIEGDFIVTNNPSLNTLSLPSLSFVVGTFFMNNSDDIISGQFSPNISVNGSVRFSNVGAFDQNLTNSFVNIAGDLIITESSWLTIEGFANLVNLGGSLAITNNDDLVSIVNGAFSNLNIVQVDLRIGSLAGVNPSPETLGNIALVDVSGLDHITTVNGNIVVENSPNLPNLNGLHNIANLGGSIRLHNLGITQISAFNNLTQINISLELSDLPLLTDISSLSGLLSIGDDLRLTNLTFYS